MDDKVYLMDVKIYDKNKNLVTTIEEVEVGSDSAKDMNKAKKIALRYFLERRYFDLPDVMKEMSMEEYVKSNREYTAEVDSYRYYFIY